MISPIDHSDDAAYKLKEVTYFMEHFRNRSNDDIATMIATDIMCFLRVGGDYHDIIDYLSELEEYSKKATGESYVWELVYIRRYLARMQGESLREVIFTSGCAMLAAEHFNTICKLAPTLFNKCCRIQEYLIANDWYKTPKLELMSEKIIQRNLEYCEKCFEEIEEEDEPMYYQTAYYLHIDLYLYSKNKSEKNVQFGYLSRLISYAMKYFENEAYYPALKNLLIAYKEATYYDEFLYEREKDNIDKALRWGEQAVADGHSEMKDSCFLLKRRVDQIKASSEE